MQKASKQHPKHPGIRARHRSTCRSFDGGTCNCRPAFEAWVFDKRTNTKRRKTFPTLAAAKTWRQDAMPAVRKGTMAAPSSVTLREAAEAFLAGAEAGTIRARNVQTYRPSTIRGYRRSLALRVLDDFGARKLGDVTRFDLQDLVDRLLAEGLSPSTIQNTIMPLRAIYRRALRRGEVATNPTTMLEIPAGRGPPRSHRTARRGRAAARGTPGRRAGVVGDRDLRRTPARRDPRAPLGGRGLRARADRGRAGMGSRLEGHAGAEDQGGQAHGAARLGASCVPARASAFTARRSGLVFGPDGETPADPDTIRHRALGCWAKVKPDALRPICLHECRHTYASLMIAAGVNAKALSTYMGHSSITITLDRYGHLFPGSEDEAAGLLDAYLEAATGTKIA